MRIPASASGRRLALSDVFCGDEKPRSCRAGVECKWFVPYASVIIRSWMGWFDLSLTLQNSPDSNWQGTPKCPLLLKPVTPAGGADKVDGVPAAETSYDSLLQVMVVVVVGVIEDHEAGGCVVCLGVDEA